MNNYSNFVRNFKKYGKISLIQSRLLNFKLQPLNFVKSDYYCYFKIFTS